MVGEAVEQGRGHLGIAEDRGPFREAEIGGDDDAGAFVEPAQQVEQQGATRGTERQVAEFVEHNEIRVSEPAGDLPGLALGLLLLERIDELDGGEDADPLAVLFDGLDAQGGGDVGFACARAANQNDVVSVFQDLAPMELANERFVDLAAGELEAAEVAVGREAGGLELVGR